MNDSPAATLTLAMVLAASGCGASPAPAGPAASHSTRAGSPASATRLPAALTPTSTTPAASGYAEPVSTKAAATKRAIRLANAVTLPPRAVRLARPPSAALGGDGTPDFSGPTLVQVARWWSVPGELESVMAQIVAHRPTGFVMCSAACPDEELSMVDLSLWPQDDSSAQTSIAVTLQQGRGHVDVRVVGRSIWNPEPTAQERVPTTVRSVSLSWRPSGSGERDLTIRPTSGTTSGARAAQVVDLLNRLPTEQPLPAPAGCYEGNVQVTARFRFDHHTLVFSWTNGNCGLTAATYDGVEQPVLMGNTLTPTIKRLLHAEGPAVAGI